MKNKEREGEIIALFESIIWGFFPIMILLAKKIPFLFSASLSMLCSAIFFAIILTFKGRWAELKIKTAWKDLFWSTWIAGIMVTALFFWGVSKTTAGNASIIALLEVFWSFLFFNLWRNEQLEVIKILGAGLMTFGSAIIFYSGDFEFNTGDLAILLATILSPLGNFFQRRARKTVDSSTIMFTRSFFSALFLFFLGLFIHDKFGHNYLESLPFIALNGILILGLSKILWLEALHRIPVVKAVAINTISPAFTLIFAFFLLNEVPSIWQIFAFLPIFLGGLLITRQ